VRFLANGLVPTLILFGLMLLMGYVAGKRRQRRVDAGEERPSPLPGLRRQSDDDAE
jgi:hypothetical protein